MFELADAGPGQVRLRAMSWATFPGLLGRAYRALVIGTGGHRLVVRGILRRVARRAAAVAAGDRSQPRQLNSS